MKTRIKKNRCQHDYKPHAFVRCEMDDSGNTLYVYTLQCAKCGKRPWFLAKKFKEKQSLFDYRLHKIYMEKDALTAEEMMDRIKNFQPKEHTIVFGASGSGKCVHPWDYLKPCSCGCKERPLLMYKKHELFYCGGPTDNVFAVCSVCGKHTEKANVGDVIDKWNNGYVFGIDAKEVKVSEISLLAMSRKQFLLSKMQKAQSFDLAEEDVDTYFNLIALYIEEHEYSAFRHMQEKHPMEPLSEWQATCSEIAINCLFRHDFVQALHEVLNVLSDHGKDTRLNYNEFVVLHNIMEVYNHVKQNDKK